MKIAILGSGTWGLALASQLAQKHEVVVWGRNGSKMAELALTRCDPRLPGIVLAPSIQVTDSFASVFDSALDSVWLACSVSGLVPLAQRLNEEVRRAQIPHVVLLSKGFSAKDGALPHQMVGAKLDVPIAVLTGPSFALEVAQGLPVALVVASKDRALCHLIQELTRLPTMRTYASDDVLGVEVGGAVKNILAIACGVSDGCGLGFNARAALLTRGLSEMIRLGVALGGRADTFFGLSGMGDLILTATGDLSRNRQAGLLLAQGLSVIEIEARLGTAIEGIRCVAQVCELARQYEIEMPVTQTVAAVLFQNQSIKQAIDNLLQRDLKLENEGIKHV